MISGTEDDLLSLRQCEGPFGVGLASSELLRSRFVPSSMNGLVGFGVECGCSFPVVEVALVDESGRGGRGDVSVGGDSDENLRGGHSSVGPGSDGRDLIGVRLHRVGTVVGERSVRSRIGRS